MDEFLERVSFHLGDFYSPESKRAFLEKCEKLAASSPEFMSIMSDKSFWDAFDVLVANLVGPAIQTGKPTIYIGMDSDTLRILTEYADSEGPALVTHGELRINPDFDNRLECRKVTERAATDELHDIMSEEHIYLDGIEFESCEGHCRINSNVSKGYGHGTMASSHFFMMHDGHLNNDLHKFDEKITRKREKNSKSLFAFKEYREWMEDFRSMSMTLLYRQDTHTTSFLSAPGYEPENVTGKSDTEIRAELIKISNEQLGAPNTNKLYADYGKTGGKTL